jgi:beta-lactamase regulating signal transducer with metallopeptidase domain
MAVLMTVVWFTGVICFLVSVAVGLWQIYRVRRVSLPWREAQMMANALADQARFSGTIDVMIHDAISGPVTCGVVRPAILFPPDARTWCDVDVRRALTHEFEHIRRRDWITLCLARVMCAVYWFHPLVWIANRQLLVSAERACDDAVLRESHAFGYADQLVTLAERSVGRARYPLVAMASDSDLSTRVRAVLDLGQQRGPAGIRARIGVAISTVLAIVVLAPLQTVVDARTQTPTLKQSLDAQQSKDEQAHAVLRLKPQQVNDLGLRAGSAIALHMVPVEISQPVAHEANLARLAVDGVGLAPAVQKRAVTMSVMTESLSKGPRPAVSVDGTVVLQDLRDVFYVGRPPSGQEQTGVGFSKVQADDMVTWIPFEDQQFANVAPDSRVH